MRKLLSLIAVMGCATLATGVAVAQDNNQYPPSPSYDDSQSLADRINRLERDLSLLQRQIYRGAPAVRPGAGGPPDQQAAASAEVRFEQIEEQMRDLNGRIEEVAHGIDQVKGRLDKLSDDVDQRLHALEQASAGQANQATIAGQPNGPAAPPSAAEDDGGTPADQQRPLVLIPPGQQKSGLNATPSSVPPGPPGKGEQQAMVAPPNAPSVGTLQAGTPQQQYDQAFGLLRDHSRNRNMRLSELAQGFINGTETLTGPTAARPRQRPEAGRPRRPGRPGPKPER